MAATGLHCLMMWLQRFCSDLPGWCMHWGHCLQPVECLAGCCCRRQAKSGPTAAELQAEIAAIKVRCS